MLLSSKCPSIERCLCLLELTEKGRDIFYMKIAFAFCKVMKGIAEVRVFHPLF